MDSKERLEVMGAITRDLTALSTESDPNELVKLTTNVVNQAKKLLEGAPESVVGEGKTVLAAFVLATRAVAQNPSSAGPKALKTLTSSRQDVEVLVRRLNNWHASKYAGSERKSSMEINLEQISPSTVRPPISPVSELEESLVRKLQDARQELRLRKEVRPANSLEEEPRSILKEAVLVLNTAVQEMEQELSKQSPGPRREPLLEPLLNVTQHVCKMLDLEDTLFVAKFPMRKQVHTFTETLLDKVLDFKMDRSAEMVREIRVNLKGLLQSAEVMVGQCHRRSQNIDDSKMRSIKRISEMKEAKERSLQDVFGQPNEPGSVHKITVESSGQAPGSQGNFDISCLVCTDCAVDQSTQQPIARGSELVLQCTSNVTVLHIKKDLSLRTGIPAVDIELCIGREPLENGFRLINHGGTPFFLFNRNEPSNQPDAPSGHGTRQIIRDEDIDWSLYSNPISRALFDYIPAAGEQHAGNLSFYEGDIVEILVKSPDGWWEGKVCDKVGLFPGSFVEEIVKSEVHAHMRVKDNGLVNSAPLMRKFPTPPNPSKSKLQRGPIPPSFLSSALKKAPSEPEVNKAKEQADSVLSAASKKSFSPRFAKKVSCLAAAGDGDSDSDDDRVLLQRQQQQQQKAKKGKEKKGSIKGKFPLAADSRTEKGATPRMVPVKDDSSSLSLQHSSPVRHQLPRSPHSSLDDLSTNAVKKCSYQLAHTCIDFLMLENRVATDRVFRLPGNMAVVKRYLEFVDNGQMPPTHDLTNVHTACSTLKALFRYDRITFIVSEFLVQEFHALAVKTAPVMAVKEKMQGLSEDPRKLLEKLLKLFAQILEHSRKNRTDISALSKTFGPLILENCSTKRAEVILAYLVSTCEFIF